MDRAALDPLDPSRDLLATLSSDQLMASRHGCVLRPPQVTCDRNTRAITKTTSKAKLRAKDCKDYIINKELSLLDYILNILNNFTNFINFVIKFTSYTNYAKLTNI